MYAMFKINALKKSFTTYTKELSILTSCSFSLEKGKTYGLIGRSGSGKSTLMHLLAGFDRPTSGTIMFNGCRIHEIESRQRAQQITFVPQHPLFIKELTVFENVALAAHIVGMEQQKIHDNTTYFLKILGLDGYQDAMVGELSGGQQQRLAVARALVVEPACLLADEPTGSLDDVTGLQLIELLLQCVKLWNMTLLLSTHNETIAHKMEVVFLLKDGIIEPTENNVQSKDFSYEHGTR